MSLIVFYSGRRGANGSRRYKIYFLLNRRVKWAKRYLEERRHFIKKLIGEGKTCTSDGPRVLN